jgi:type VI secretion system protein ImpH
VGSPSRRTDPSLTNPSLEEALFDRGYEFDFFQAVRLLSRVFPRRRDVGAAAKPGEEFARFGAQLTMAFPASAIHNIDRSEGSGDPVRVVVAFMALTGTQGVLPFFYTEKMIARAAAKDDTLAAFFDLFNHRLISLFYRAWKKHRPPVLYESGAMRGAVPDPFTQNLFDLIGMGTVGLRERLGVKDESLLLYAGLIAQRPHSATALRSILRNYFAAEIEIDQCLGDWYALDDTDRCCLLGESESNQLGTGAFLGDEVWNQQGRFRVRAGPLPLERFLDFLPEGLAMSRLVDLTQFFVGQALAFDVQVILRRDEVPYCRLDDQGSDAPRLGWMGWLKTSDFEADADDAVFQWVN